MTRLVDGGCRRLVMSKVSDGFDTQGAALLGVGLKFLTAGLTYSSIAPPREPINGI